MHNWSNNFLDKYGFTITFNFVTWISEYSIILKCSPHCTKLFYLSKVVIKPGRYIYKKVA